MSTLGLIVAIYITAIPCFILSIMSLASASGHGIVLAELALLLVSIAALLLTTTDDAQMTVITWLLGTLIGVPIALMVPLMAGPESAELSWLSISNTIAAGAAVSALDLVGDRWALLFAIVGVTAATINLSGSLITDRMLKKGSPK